MRKSVFSIISFYLLLSCIMPEVITVIIRETEIKNEMFYIHHIISPAILSFAFKIFFAYFIIEFFFANLVKCV